MILASITRVLDEADIIEAFVRHTAFYVDHLIFLDNGSRDGTLQILSHLEDEGFSILVYQNKSVSFQEAPFNTKMFMDATGIFHADWVLCLDADEFIDDARVDGGLRTALRRLDEAEAKTLALRVPLFEYRRSLQDDATETNVALRQTRHLHPFGVDKVFLSGALASMAVTVGGGNHDAFLNGKAVASSVEPGLRLAHFAERSHHQIAAKWIKGWAKVLATGLVATSSGASAHYRGPFEILRDRPEDLLRNKGFIDNLDGHDFVLDPIAYRGGALRYTRPIDDAMRSIRMIVGYLEELATRYGYLVETCPGASAAIGALDDNFGVVIGHALLNGAAPSAHLTPRAARPRSGAPTHFPPSRSGTSSFSLFRCVIVWRASRAIDRGYFSKADRLLRQRVEQAPKDAGLLKLYAFSAHNSGRYREAIVRWSKARTAAPDDPMCHAGIAANLHEIGALDFAADAINAALVLFPLDGIVLTEASRIAAARAHFAEALALTNRAIILLGASPLLAEERRRLEQMMQNEDERASVTAHEKG